MLIAICKARLLHMKLRLQLEIVSLYNHNSYVQNTETGQYRYSIDTTRDIDGYCITKSKYTAHAFRTKRHCQYSYWLHLIPLSVQ